MICAALDLNYIRGYYIREVYFVAIRRITIARPWPTNVIDEKCCCVLNVQNRFLQFAELGSVVNGKLNYRVSDAARHSTQPVALVQAKDVAHRVKDELYPSEKVAAGSPSPPYRLKHLSFDSQVLGPFAGKPGLGFHAGMAPKYHPTPVSGSHRKALAKALMHSRAMTSILGQRAAETRAAGEAMIREVDDLLCQSWNERMWADGEPVDPSPTVDQAINGGYTWLEIACSRCRTPRTVDLASLPHVPTTCVHDLAGRLRCEKCRKAGKRPPAELRQLAKRRRHDPDAMA